MVSLFFFLIIYSQSKTKKKPTTTSVALCKPLCVRAHGSCSLPARAEHVLGSPGILIKSRLYQKSFLRLKNQGSQKQQRRGELGAAGMLPLERGRR